MQGDWLTIHESKAPRSNDVIGYTDYLCQNLWYFLHFIVYQQRFNYYDLCDYFITVILHEIFTFKLF